MTSTTCVHGASEHGHPDAKDAKVPQNTQKEQPGCEDCTREIIGVAVEVQKVLGVGLLESAYAGAFAHELARTGLKFKREVPIYANYKGEPVGLAFRADFIVEDSVIVCPLSTTRNHAPYPEKT